MIRLIFSAVLLALLAVLLAFNLRFTASVSLFGVLLQDVPVAAIALLSFAAGILYSLVIYLGNALAARRRRDLAERHRQLEVREQDLAARSAQAMTAAPTTDSAPAGDPGAPPPDPAPPDPAPQGAPNAPAPARSRLRSWLGL